MNKAVKILLFILGFFLLLISTGALLFWNNWRQDLKPIVEELKLSQKDIKIGRPTKVTVVIKTPWYRQLKAPVTLKGEDDIQISKVAIIKPISIDTEALYWQLDTEFIGFKQGSFKELTLQVNVSADKSGNSSQLIIDLPELKISPREITKKDTISTHSTLNDDIFKSPDLPVEESKKGLWVTIFLIATCLILWILFRRQKTSIIKRLPAWEEAQLALAELQSNENINDEKFFVKLSDILRLYIEKRFRLPATEKTSEEFIREVRSSSTLSEEHKFSLENFMNTADMVKFAKMAADSKQRQDCLSIAGSFVQETIPQTSKEGQSV